MRLLEVVVANGAEIPDPWVLFIAGRARERDVESVIVRQEMFLSSLHCCV